MPARGGGAADVARHCFIWVRDEVQHSFDYKRDQVTCAASKVLEQRTGLCYAKSHLLAALLRANGIPSGFCYQRLTVDGKLDGPHVLHGLNAVFLDGCGWYRMDARGNGGDNHAEFSPPSEKLAFQLRPDLGEYDLPGIYAQPLAVVVEALRSAPCCEELWSKLPDVPSGLPEPDHT